MNLEELYKLTKAKALVLIGIDGNIVDSYHQEDLNNLDKIAPFTSIMVNMVDDFFTNIISVKKSNEMIIKSDNHSFYLFRCDDEHILCVLAEGMVNTSLISLSIKKKVKQ